MYRVLVGIFTVPRMRKLFQPPFNIVHRRQGRDTSVPTGNTSRSYARAPGLNESVNLFLIEGTVFGSCFESMCECGNLIIAQV